VLLGVLRYALGLNAALPLAALGFAALVSAAFVAVLQLVHAMRVRAC
jgi:hypothetical protein